MKYFLPCILAVAALARTPPSELPTCSLSGANGESSATTGPQGQYAFRKLEPGRHWVSVYDKSRAASGGTYVLLNPGQELTGVEIYVKAGGSIAGRVFDEDRQPVSGAAVILLEATFEFGRPAYSPTLTAQTDHNGEYRLAPVPAERGHLILAKKAVKPSDPTDSMLEVPEKRPRLPMPTFYPSSPDAEGGQAVTLGSAEDRRGMDIQITSAPSYCIDGAVRMSGGAGAPNLTVTEQLPLVFRSSLTPARMTVSEGKFRACGFHPGEYRLSAVGNEDPDSRPPGIRRFQMDAFAQVIITDRDAQDVQLLPSSAVTLSGEAVWESEPRGKTAGARIRIGLQKFWNDRHADDSESPNQIAGGLSYGDRVRVPGPFALEGIPVGDYTLDLSGLPDGCYIKDATYAGISVLHQPLRLTQTAGEGRLRLVLACDGGSLTARVTDRDGNPVSHVHLYVMPEEAGSAAALHDVLRQAEVEKGWSGIVTPLPPGKYLVLACDLETDGTAEPILRLWRARSKAKKVEIGAGEATQATLEIEEGGLF